MAHFPRWLRLSILKTATGVLLGSLTTGAVIWLGHGPFPEIHEFGFDMGLNVRLALVRMQNLSSGLPLIEPGSRTDLTHASTGFVFLDVDPDNQEGTTPQKEAGPAPACKALEDASGQYCLIASEAQAA